MLVMICQDVALMLCYSQLCVHDTMESLYEVVGMDVLPDEYLPDDYTGPSGGPFKQIIRTYCHCTNKLY